MGLGPGSGILAFGLASSLSGIGCAATQTGERSPPAYYQTAYPSHDVSEELGAVWTSVKRILVSGMYHTWVFDELGAPTDAEPLDDEVLSRAIRTTSQYRGRAATAVVLSVRERNALLLTAEHSIDFPDTVAQYFEAGGSEAVTGGAPGGLRAVSVLVQRSNGIRIGKGLEPFQVLARDPDHDLALIGVRLPPGPDQDAISPLPVPAGRSSRLSWGSFVYTVGFPGGYPMVTRGIVSDPGRSPARRFLTDGMWNEGMSGGLVLAVRGRGGGLEWVGMARASAGTVEYRLGAPEQVEEAHEPWRPYSGPIFIREMKRIQYGISHSVPLGPIRRFLARHRSELEGSGYSVPLLPP